MAARIRLAQAALVLGTVLVSLLLMEGALRLLGMFPPKTQYSQFIEHDARRGWRNVPGASGHLTTDEFHVALDYNARGYRGPLYPYARPAGTRRVLMLGDSFVEGFTVAREERVSEQLAALLTSASAPAEVIALGTGGYGTDQQLLWLLDEGLRYEPDVVVVMFYYNDIWHNGAAAYGLGPKPRYVLDGDSLRLENVPVPPPAPTTRRLSPFRRGVVWLAEHSHLGALGSRAIKSSDVVYRLAARLGVTDPAAGSAGSDEEPPMLDEFRVFQRDTQPEVEEAWVMTERLLLEIVRRSSERGAQTVLFHIPFRFALRAPEQEARPGGPLDPLARPSMDRSAVARRFSEMCGRLATMCIEPTTAFRDRSGAGREPLYFTYDWHWTPAGHAMAARLLADSVAAATARGATTAAR